MKATVGWLIVTPFQKQSSGRVEWGDTLKISKTQPQQIRYLVQSTFTFTSDHVHGNAHPRSKVPHANGTQHHTLNGFLKEQRILIQKIFNRDLNAKVIIVLSGPSNSTTSMVAAICHAWLLGYRERENDDGNECVVVPVINVRRRTMWKLKQPAWLFFHATLDATALLFADEVDLEILMMTGKLSLLVVGQDILSATGEVGSQCTILTDNYCEDAYDLLQSPVLKKLLLAGILLDTQNLKASASITMTREAEAVQLLLVGSAPNYRYALFDQLMQDQKTISFVEALTDNYGKPPDKREQNGEGNMARKVGERKSTSISDCEAIMSSPKENPIVTKGAKTNKVSPKSVSLFYFVPNINLVTSLILAAKLISPPLPSPTPTPAHEEKDASRGKNKFFLARWFGFGSK